MQLEARRDGGDFRLSGCKRHVLFASSASRLLVLARSGPAEHDVELLLVDPKSPGVRLTQQRSLAADTQYRVDFEDVRPDWSSLPADSFPVLRVNGSLNASAPWSGRGVLIVTEQFEANPSFIWSGIVLAGWVDDRIMGAIDGMLVGGFSTSDPYDEVQTRGPIRYHSCNVARANESLSYLELIENTLFELD